jgi:hypothetical protein
MLMTSQTYEPPPDDDSGREALRRMIRAWGVKINLAVVARDLNIEVVRLKGQAHRQRAEDHSRQSRTRRRRSPASQAHGKPS